jgi:hypothetical protein
MAAHIVRREGGNCSGALLLKTQQQQQQKQHKTALEANERRTLVCYNEQEAQTGK